MGNRIFPPAICDLYFCLSDVEDNSTYPEEDMQLNPFTFFEFPIKQTFTSELIEQS